jgi:hypothetical protein
MGQTIEEGRAACKNLAVFFLFPSKRFLLISQKNSVVGNIMQYLNHEYSNKHICSARKGSEEGQRGYCPFSELKI